MVGKIKNMLRALSLFVLLAVLMSINQPTLASPSSVDQGDMQIIDQARPEFQHILQGQTGIGVGITPAIINKGEMATVTVNLNNVPVEGYVSVEVTCTYYPDLVEVRDIVVGDLFGTDPVVAIHGPQSDHFVAAIAGSHGSKATTSGTILTFHVIGLQLGLFPITCEARVSTGDQTLTNLSPISNDLIVLSPTSTPKTDLCDSAEFIADVTHPPGTVMSPGEAFRKTWRLMNVGTCAWSQAYQLVFFSGTSMSTVSPLNFTVRVSPGVTVDISLDMIAPSAAGSYTGNWMLKNASGALFGIGPLANEPFSVNIIVADTTITPSVTVSPAPSVTSFPSMSTATPTPDVIIVDTATPLPNGSITGHVMANKPVTVGLYDADGKLLASVSANTDGAFTLTIPPRFYWIVATAPGFLSASGSATVTSGVTTSLPAITLFAGDIDNNNIIDQFDALTIGVNYNGTIPPIADLNNDGIINVLDLELLAKNYRKTGPTVWQ